MTNRTILWPLKNDVTGGGTRGQISKKKGQQEEGVSAKCDVTTQKKWQVFGLVKWPLKNHVTGGGTRGQISEKKRQQKEGVSAKSDVTTQKKIASFRVGQTYVLFEWSLEKILLFKKKVQKRCSYKFHKIRKKTPVQFY